MNEVICPEPTYKELKKRILSSTSLNELVEAEIRAANSDLSKEQKTTLYKYVRARAGNYL